MKLPPEGQAAGAEIEAKVGALIDTRLSWDQLKPEFAKLYSDSFTEEELDGLLAFGKTPTGAASLAKMPGLLQKGAQLGGAKLQGFQADAMKIVQEALKNVPRPAPKPAAAAAPATPAAPPAAPTPEKK
jgi:hypothetical protein